MQPSKIFFFISASLIFGEVYSYIGKLLSNRYCKEDEIDEIIFTNQLLERRSNLTKRVKFSNEPVLQVMELLENLILSSRKSVHVMMYIFTSKDLAKALKNVHERGVHVLVLIDSSQKNSTGSRGQFLHDAGIEVRVMNENETLHLKMCLIDADYDDKNFVRSAVNPDAKNFKRTVAIPDHGCVISGSLNWTREALTKNHENISVNGKPKVVQKTANKFYDIWSKAQSF